MFERNRNIINLDKNIEIAYIRTNEKKNLKLINEPVNITIENNDTNSSSSNNSCIMNHKETTIISFIITLIILFIDYN